MLTFKVNYEPTNIQQTDLLRPKNLRFSSRTNLIKTRYMQGTKKINYEKNWTDFIEYFTIKL